MVAAKKLDNTYFLIYSTSYEINKRIDKLLSVEVPNYKHDTRYKMGKWDGTEKFYKITDAKDGKLFKISLGFWKLIEAAIEFDDVDKSIKEYFKKRHNKEILNYFKEEIPKLPFVPYKHQLAAIQGFYQNPMHLAKVATGGGKSLIAYLWVKYLYKNNKKGMIVVPSVGLVTQLYNDFKDYGCDFLKDIKLIGGEFNEKDLSYPITITTWQSLQKVIDDINCDYILVDEAHLAKADQLQLIIHSNIPYRYGMTGSVPIIKLDKMKIISAFGVPKKYINAKELMDKGLLTFTEIIAIFLNYPRSCTKSGLSYHEEVKLIKENNRRRNFIKNFLLGLKGTTVALYSHEQHGIDTYVSLTGEKPKFNDFEKMKSLGVFFICGKTKSKVREQIRQYMNKYSVIVIGQYGVLSTGINVPNLKNLVFLSSTKSYTLVLQSIGRVMRLYKSKGKKVHVFDLVDVFDYKKETYSMKHFWERLKYYEDEGHPVKEVEIDLKKF